MRPSRPCDFRNDCPDKSEPVPVVEDFAAVVASIKDNKGVDMIFDFIGAPYFGRNVNALNFGGRLVQIGVMGGIENAKIPLVRVL